MKILVFDDNVNHRAAAVAQLVGHDLTVVGTYDEAQELVESKIDQEKMFQILKSQFGDFNPWRSDDEEKKKSYRVAEKLAEKEATYHPDFDAVLVDLLVPNSGQSQGGKWSRTQEEMPVGAFIALLAAKNGAKYAAVLTDSSHHDHPASACFDAFNKYEGQPTSFKVNDCKMIFCNNRNWVEEFDPKDFSKPLEYEQYKDRSDTVRGKNWLALLDYLVNK